MEKNQPQNYQNHKKITPLQHFILMPLALILLILSFVYVVTSKGSFPALLFLLTSIGIIILGMLVRIYSMKIQDRLIWNEVNFRHIQLTGQGLDAKLQLRQVIALRFAEDDDEFLALCQRAVGEGTAPDSIKRSITRWRADHWRV